VGAAVTFAVAAAAGAVGGKLTGEITFASVVFGVLVLSGMLVTYWVDRETGKAEAKRSQPDGRPSGNYVNKLKASQSGAGNTQNNLIITFNRRYLDSNKNGSVRRGPAAAILLVATLLAVGIPVLTQELLAQHDGAPRLAPKTRPGSTSSSPPVLIENVTALTSPFGGQGSSVALPRRFSMTPSELTSFNKAVVTNSRKYSRWFTSNEGAPVDFAVMSITLKGNSRQSVRIANMQVVKSCSNPFTGTYIGGYTQGTGAPVKIGFDLDSADPIPQQLGLGFTPLGINFFDQEYISLRLGKQITLSIGAFTNHYACHFRIYMTVATAHGAVKEEIGNHGSPFVVTAKAAPTRKTLPYSGYRSVYLYSATDGAIGGWKPINPARYK
jgi:hypothetical protein